MLKKMKKIISCIFVFLAYRICLSVPKLLGKLRRCGYMAGNRSRFSKHEMAGSPILSVNFTKSKDFS